MRATRLPLCVTIHRRLPPSLPDRIGGDDVRPSFPPRAAVCVSLQPELGAGNRVETVDVLPTTGVVWCGAARAVAPSED